MTGKPVEHGYVENRSKVLVSLEDFTSLRGEELLQNIYMVVIYYNLNMEKISDWVLREWSVDWVINKITSSLKDDRKYVYCGADFDEILRSRYEIIESIKELESKLVDDMKEYVKDERPDGMNVDAIKSDMSSRVMKFVEDYVKNLKGCVSGCENFCMSRGDEMRYMPQSRYERLGIKKACNRKIFEDDYNKALYLNSSEDFFFASRSPIFRVQKGRVHQFPDGCPLFYGVPNRQTSVYVALLDPGENSLNDHDLGAECEQELIQSVKSLQSIHYELSKFLNQEVKKLIDIAERERYIFDHFLAVEKGFSLLIKSFETQALKRNHQIRYTNVFTFKEDDEWLEGGHQDWGDHRMAITIKVDVSK